MATATACSGHAGVGGPQTSVQVHVSRLLCIPMYMIELASIDCASHHALLLCGLHSFAV